MTLSKLRFCYLNAHGLHIYRLTFCVGVDWGYVASSGLVPGTLDLEKAMEPSIDRATKRLITGMGTACSLLLLFCLVFALWTQGLLDCVPVEVRLP